MFTLVVHGLFVMFVYGCCCARECIGPDLHVCVYCTYACAVLNKAQLLLGAQHMISNQETFFLICSISWFDITGCAFCFNRTKLLLDVVTVIRSKWTAHYNSWNFCLFFMDNHWYSKLHTYNLVTLQRVIAHGMQNHLLSPLLTSLASKIPECLGESTNVSDIVISGTSQTTRRYLMMFSLLISLCLRQA